MIKFLRLIVLINTVFFLASCSFKNPGGFFDDAMKELEEEIEKKNSKLVFSPQKKFKQEIVGNTPSKIRESLISENWLQNNFTSGNYIPHLYYENKKQLVYKSKKIGKNKFPLSDLFFEPLLLNGKIFFQDSSGNIYNFSVQDRKLIWKFNFYKKRYKSVPILIKLKISKNNLIVTDNIGYIYSLEIETGKLTWAKNYGIPFRSNIKIDKENIFILNQDNKYYSIREKDGNQNLSLETFPSLIKSKNQTNISLDTDNNNTYFITSNGEVYSINYKTKNINWFSNVFMATQGSSDLFYSSPIIYKNETIFFSSSYSTYSINARNGSINWELPFSTYLRPLVTENFIFLASKNGFFLNVNNKTGKVIWSRDLFKNNKKLKKDKIGNITSLILISDQILATTSEGFFIFVDYRDGKIINYTKASRAGFSSNPIVVNKMIHVIDKNMRVLIFN